MQYEFLNDTFKSFITDGSVSIPDLQKYIAFKEKNFILNHNIEALANIIKFLNSNDNIFILNGFMGSGKTYTADCLSEFISDKVLVFKNSYQEAINCDDILLSLFKDFTIYHNSRKITLPKVETNIFSEKINAYIKSCEAPMLFIFDSFEINMRSKDTQKDILDFILYLSHFARIKIVICSRTFKAADMMSSASVKSYTLESLQEAEFNDYIEQNQITGSKYDIESLYKITRGHYLLLELSVMIMKLLGLNLGAFTTEYKKSKNNFLEYLISKILSVSGEKFIKLMAFFSLIRHGVSSDFIVNQYIAQEDDLEFLLQKQVITEKFDKYYLKDYIKQEYLKNLNSMTKLRMHKFIKEVYEEELPLKPFERQLLLSRLTMRQEIAYHGKQIEMLEAELEKSSTPWSKDNQGMPYLSYVKSSGYNVTEENKHGAKREIISAKLRDDKFKKITNDKPLYTGIKVNEPVKEDFVSDIEQKEIKPESTNNNVENLIPDSISDYIKLAEDCEKIYKYNDAILYYRRALTYKNEDDFEKTEPIIYLKLADCYKKIQDIDQAVSLYEKVYQIYKSKSDKDADDILIKIAHIYIEVFKFEKAKEIYNKITESRNASDSIKIKVYIELAELEERNDNIKGAAEYFKSAVTLAQKNSDAGILSECYYKYALLLDEINNLDLAQKYYLRCIQVSADINVNVNLAYAYSNLADISYDSNNMNAAKMYYELAIDADTKINNTEGLYFSYSKAAQIYAKENSSKALDYLIQALQYAKKSEDMEYTILAYEAIGDYHLRLKSYKEAIKSYILAQTFDPASISEELAIRLEKKSDRIKMTLGQSAYDEILEDIKKKR